METTSQDFHKSLFNLLRESASGDEPKRDKQVKDIESIMTILDERKKSKRAEGAPSFLQIIGVKP